MGGNALAHLGVSRVTTVELVTVYNRISRQLLLSGHGLFPHLVPWIDSKTDHGDIDLIVKCDGPSHIIRALRINSNQWHSINGDVISVAIPISEDPTGRRVQVDFICIKEAVDHHRLFYSGGDFGLLIGRIAAWNGLTFAQEGLRLRHCEELGTDQDILLTSNPVESMNLLGYFSLPGSFSTYEDLWSWVMCSRMAHPDMFKPESTNAENRSRDKERPMVEKFQTWLSTQECLKNCPARTNGAWYFQRLPEHLRELVDDELLRRDGEASLVKEITACFGMGAVKHVLGLEGAEAGEVVRAMQPFLPEKIERRRLYTSNPKMATLMAQNAAWAAAHCLGLGLKMVAPQGLEPR